MNPAISGSYRGRLASGKQRLDLRIDVDARITDAAVLNRVSGDIFRVDSVAVPGKPPKETEIYQESWILEAPQMQSGSDAVVITGLVRFWNAVHSKTSATIRIPLQPAGAAAEVTLLRQASPPMTFSCAPAGKFFRSFHLEVDVCKSVNSEPTLPQYSTHALKQRPPGLSDRVLTLERTYGEAGVELLMRTEARSIIDDTAPGFEGWTDAELHNAMERQFTQYKGSWPQWELWALVAGLYNDDLVAGVMFDYAAAQGGPKKAPERQGFAVFRKHFWFDSLVPNPTTTAELEAARRFLWVFTHEAGHAFNLLHSFDKNRENALSWMNYVENYDDLHGAGSYWNGFRFTFDDEELLHIRHGNRPSVIMGGDPFSSGGHAEAPPGAEHLRMPPGAMTSISGEVPLDVSVRTQPYFEFLEPVSLVIRVQNLMPMPVSVSSTLHPEFGAVTIYVRRPDGRLVEYMPIACKVAPDRTIILSPTGAADDSDKHTRTVFVSYGRYGFYFDEPGQYYVRVVYHGPGNMLIPSNVLRLRVGYPKSERLDRLAQDYFSYESGCALYLGGSHSEFLTDGMNALMEVAEEKGDTLAGAVTAGRIARGVGTAFHDVDPSDQHVRRTTRGDSKTALRLTDIALKGFRKHPLRTLNIAMERVVRTRADIFRGMGDTERARDEMLDLAGTFAHSGVKPSVVAQLQTDAESLAPRRPRRRATHKTPRRR